MGIGLGIGLGMLAADLLKSQTKANLEITLRKKSKKNAARDNPRGQFWVGIPTHLGWDFDHPAISRNCAFVIRQLISGLEA